ncbi:hypothetical protein IWQ48_003694 [Labrenzia sp. EL_13]|nr:hypothetical protein [Labrenzia sp. EL_142]MBG6158486.1 hypothetical protein [Labrenzia sp. EL_162]MBG6196501.1 hypothetical protein [Labrenzia sp. EL_159]MBG6202547.1 hypothetical protein [Labrenzia sp. EL_13]
MDVFGSGQEFLHDISERFGRLMLICHDFDSGMHCKRAENPQYGQQDRNRPEVQHLHDQ